MKIVKIKGGLGNQMFQYGFAKLMEKLTGEEIKIDMSSYDKFINDSIRKPRLLKYNISLSIASFSEIENMKKFQVNSPLTNFDKLKVVLEVISNRKYYLETNRGYREPDQLVNYSYFDGYWQSWRYVEKIEKELRKEFLPNYQMNINTINLQKEIERENSVFIGIRRGDYLTDKRHYGSFGEQYYNAAIRKIVKTVNNPVFYIFSNDIGWVKKNLDLDRHRVVYRENENIIDDFEELQLMASCKHSIIGNSTFHWWGAWLINNPDKIIVAPKRWFFDNKPIDIVPPTWIRIDENGESE